ncbi:hypothetical protein ACWD4O_36980 [Streptomyces sp. NPDC002623]
MTAARPAQAPADLFFDSVVNGHLSGPQVVERDWLVRSVEAAVRDGNHVLLTAEPGAGKTGLMAALARRHPGWLRYFVRRDSRSALSGGDTQSLLLTLGHQLAVERAELFDPGLLEVVVRQRIDEVAENGTVTGVRVEDLMVSPFYRTSIRVTQQVGRTRGVVHGLDIGRLHVEPRLLETGNLAMLALLGPAAALARRSPDERIVVLVDALDELADHEGGGGMLQWLCTSPLPANVSLVVASRPQSDLVLFRSARAERLTEIAVAPEHPQTRADVLACLDRFLALPEVTETLDDRDIDRQALRAAVAARAHGNFAYLVSYGRSLSETIRRGDWESVDRLMAYQELPHGLDDLYLYFLHQFRLAVRQLGLLPVRDPQSPQDLGVPAWEGVGRPLLGVLAVARKELSVEQLGRLAGIRTWPSGLQCVIERLMPFLDQDAEGLRLFHGSLAEFLVSPDTLRAHPQIAVDAGEWHDRIVRAYQGTARSLRDVDWATVDRYGLWCLPDHILAREGSGPDAILDLVCAGFRLASSAASRSNLHFDGVVKRAAERSRRKANVVTAVSEVLFLGLVRTGLRRQGAGAAPGVLGLAARLGRIDEALDRLALQEPSAQKFQGLMEIRRHGGDEELSRHADRTGLDALVDCALAIPGGSDAVSCSPRRQSISLAAAALAPTDFDRALSLVPLAERVRDDAEKEVRIAAARSADQDSAVELLRTVSAAPRCRVLLDLSNTGEGAGRLRLLTLAEEAVGQVDPTEAMPLHARLAASWLRTGDPTRARPHQDTLRRRLGQAREDWTEAEWYEPARQWVAAASMLVTTDGPLAGMLLSAVGAGVGAGDYLTRHSMISAVGVWARLGDLENCLRTVRQVVDGLTDVTRAKTAETYADLAAKVREAHPRTARHLLDQALKMIDEDRGTLDAEDHGSPIPSAVTALLARDEGDDIEAALRLARRIRRTDWVNGSAADWATDRASVLARIGHRLAEDRPDRAHAVLDECFADEDRPPVFGESSAVSRRVGYFRLDDGTPRSPSTTSEDLALGINALERLQWVHAQQLFRDPADVVRAALPSPSDISSPYRWSRTLRVAAELLLEVDPRGAARAVRRLADPVEHAIGAAALAAHASAHDNPCAPQMWASAHEALAAVPDYYTDPALDFDAADPARTAQILNPQARAGFEAALRMIPAVGFFAAHTLVEAASSDWLSAGVAAVGLCQSVETFVGDRSALARMSQASRASFGADLTDTLVQGDPVLGSVTLRRLSVTASRVGLSFPVERIAHPVYRALAAVETADDPAHVLHKELGRLPEGVPPHHTVAIAGAAAAAAWERADRAGAAESARWAVDRALALPPWIRTLALLHLLDAPHADLYLDTARLFTVLHQTLDALPFPEMEEELRRRMFPVALRIQPTAAAPLLDDIVKSSWRETMAALQDGWASLIALEGAAAVDSVELSIVRALDCLRPTDAATAKGSTGESRLLDGVTVRQAESAARPA